MDLILQIWGGSFYLANKICFAVAEGAKRDSQRRLKMAGWAIYLLGVPAWVLILLLKSDWIAASIEAGGIPAMVLGLYNVYTHCQRPNRYLDAFASFCTYAFILVGVGYSLYDYRGITSLSQVLEIGATVGFLMGSYLLAQGRVSGWLFFMLMNASMGSLMGYQGKPILAIQQALSLCFVVYGLFSALRMQRLQKSLPEEKVF
jgi:hypothetical protein